MRCFGEALSLFFKLLFLSKFIIAIDEDYSGDDDEAPSLTISNENRLTTKSSFAKLEQKDGGDKSHLIKQAVGELKSVLNKPIPTRMKTAILEKIFDAQGDPSKANLANEIFRKALEPSLPTHGAVGELGAEMIKISVLSKANKHFAIGTSPKLSRLASKKNRTRQKKRKKSKASDVLTTQKMSNSEHVSQFKARTTTKRRNYAEQRINRAKTRDAYKLAWKYINKKLKSMLARKRKLSKYELKPVSNSTENKNLQYTLVRAKPKPTIDLKGKTAKLLSVKVQRPRHNPMKKNHSSFNSTFRERKDYVIELDDSNNDEQEYDSNGDRRHLDSVVSLLRRLSLPSNGEVEVVEDNEEKYNKDFDDGYISPQRRRFGENLFLSNFADEEDDDDDEEVVPSDEPPYQNELDSVNDDDELLEPRFDERDENEDVPIRYGEEENFFSNRPSINPYVRMTDGVGSNDNKPVVMEYDVKKRNQIN